MIAETLEKWFTSTPAYRQAVAAEAEATLRQRKATADRRAEVAAAAEKARKPLLAKVEAADAKWHSAFDAERRAFGELGEAKRALLDADGRADREQERLAKELRATASPAIGEFLDELEEHIRAVRRAQSPVASVASVTDRDVFGRTFVTEQGRVALAQGEARNRWLIRAREVSRQAAEELPLLALSPEELAARIAKIKADLGDPLADEPAA